MAKKEGDESGLYMEYVVGRSAGEWVPAALCLRWKTGTVSTKGCCVQFLSLWRRWCGDGVEDLGVQIGSHRAVRTCKRSGNRTNLSGRNFSPNHSETCRLWDGRV